MLAAISSELIPISPQPLVLNSQSSFLSTFSQGLVSCPRANSGWLILFDPPSYHPRSFSPGSSAELSGIIHFLHNISRGFPCRLSAGLSSSFSIRFPSPSWLSCRTLWHHPLSLQNLTGFPLPLIRWLLQLFLLRFQGSTFEASLLDLLPNSLASSRPF